ncbi:MAG: hypothetical protein CM1200mP10_02420 [Candidatus Neomarinimicrobiota bacterium]|nr:MAG: hypothetical protein CM1200mP10_02420 [Candidatus Neomarinimicrobiota bacterium]
MPPVTTSLLRILRQKLKHKGLVRGYGIDYYPCNTPILGKLAGLNLPPSRPRWATIIVEKIKMKKTIVLYLELT